MCTPRVTDLIDQALQAERFGRFDEARGSLRQAVLVSQPSQAIDCRLRLAKLLISGGHAHDAEAEAEALLTTARLQAEQQGTPRQAATAIHLLALLERGRGRLDRALQMLDESPACQQATAPDPALGQLIHYRGLVEADRGNLNEAERLLFQAHQVYKEAHHDAGLAEVCDSLANLLLKRGKSQAALAFARMSLERKSELGDRFGEAITLGTLGRAYLLRACYVEAAGAFAHDLAIVRELGDQRGIGIMLNSLGEVALLQKDLDTAASHYQDSLAEDRGPWNSIHAHRRSSSAGLRRSCRSARSPPPTQQAYSDRGDPVLPFRRVPLAWANLVHNKVKLAASLAGITFAVALMFMEMGFYNALLDGMVGLLRKLDADLIRV